MENGDTQLFIIQICSMMCKFLSTLYILYLGYFHRLVFELLNID